MKNIGKFFYVMLCVIALTNLSGCDSSNSGGSTTTNTNETTMTWDQDNWNEKNWD